MRNLFQIERNKCTLTLVEADAARIAEALGVVDGHLIVVAAVLGLVRIRSRDDGQVIMRRELHEIRVRRDLVDGIAVVRARIDVDDHISFLERLRHAREVRRHICLLYTSPSPRDASKSRMPSSA